MKDLIVTLVITLALVIYFGQPAEKLPSWCFGTQYEGDSGPVLPGGSELTAQPESPPELLEPLETSESSATEETKPHIEVITKETRNMDGTLIAFWLGIVAVLIGEASALLVAFAWKKWCSWANE